MTAHWLTASVELAATRIVRATVEESADGDHFVLFEVHTTIKGEAAPHGGFKRYGEFSTLHKLVKSSFSLKLSETPPAAAVALSSVPTSVCVDVANTGKRASPMVVALFSAPSKPPAGLRLVPNRQLIGFDKALTSPGTAAVKICFEISDADLAMVDDVGSHIAFEGDYVLTFFDGASKVMSKARIETTRTVAIIPPVDNPQPPCCQGSETSCC